jgi:hypothetical protein
MIEAQDGVGGGTVCTGAYKPKYKVKMFCDLMQSEFPYECVMEETYRFHG